MSGEQQAASRCQPVLFGQPAEKLWRNLRIGNSSTASTRVVGKLPTTDRLAAWAPQNFVASRPQEIRLPAIRGSDVAKKMRKKS